jgi:hypothetical protein
LTSRTPRKSRASVRTRTWPRRASLVALSAFRGQRDGDAHDEEEARKDDVGQRERVLAGGGVPEDEGNGLHAREIVDEDHRQDVETAERVEAGQAFAPAVR